MGWLDNWKQDEQVISEPGPGQLDLRPAALVAGPGRPTLYAEILAREVFKRSRVVLPVLESIPGDGRWAVVVHLSVEQGNAELGDEGYQISVRDSGLNGLVLVQLLAGTDRGLLFSVGRLLREMVLDHHQSYSTPLTRVCCIDQDLQISSRPAYSMRMHQVAYRPKTNAYDAFSVEMMRQEVLDLALFGTNGIEVIPPGIDDADQSPNFRVAWLEMLHEVSSWCQQLDLRLSIWYPAFFKDYTDPATLRKAEAQWAVVFNSLARLDMLFVPGGDPGGRPAAEFFAVVRRQAAFVRSVHPGCELWVSSQYGLSVSVDLGLSEPWVPLEEEEAWFEQLGTAEVSSLVDGVVYGPWSCLPIDEFRARLPDNYPLRNYPDLCHVQTAEMAVSHWDVAFSTLNNRESVNPRPLEFLNVFADQAPHSIGWPVLADRRAKLVGSCGCYSEGVNDDVNKYVWSVLHWGPDLQGPLANATPQATLRAGMLQYAGLLCDFARGRQLLCDALYGLESNWQGDLYSSTALPQTSQLFEKVEQQMTPRHRSNWRINLLLFRHFHDALSYTRLREERQLEQRALMELKEGLDSGTDQHDLHAHRALQMLQSTPYHEPPIATSSFHSKSLTNALNVVQATPQATVTHLYGQLLALASSLRHQIGYQLSIGFGGQHRQRGAYLDLIWSPLGDVQSLCRAVKARMHPAASLSSVDQHLLQRLNWSLRETGGSSTLWYASFGDPAAQAPDLSSHPAARGASLPVWKVLPPYHELELGEDPVYFKRPLIEYSDFSNDKMVERLHDGSIPRAWRSYLVSIWPRTCSYSLKLPLNELNAAEFGPQGKLTVRVTYIGRDLNIHGGDWQELDRQAMPSRLLANGIELHPFMEAPEITHSHDFCIPAAAFATSGSQLELTFEGQEPRKNTYRYVPIPVAEVWLLAEDGRGIASVASKL